MSCGKGEARGAPPLMPDTLIHTWKTATFEPPKWLFPTMFTPTLTQPNPPGDAREYKEAIGETAITRHARGGTVPTPLDNKVDNTVSRQAAKMGFDAWIFKMDSRHARRLDDRPATF